MVFKKGNVWCRNRLGIPCSEETKQKISKAHKGKKLSEEHKEKIGLNSRGKTYEERYGKNKGKILRKIRSIAMKNIPKTKEAKEKMSIAKKGKYKGKNNPSYINGNSIGDGEKYNYEFTKELKTKIRKRDKFVCQICGKNGFSVHHIDYNKLNNKENNLITLCRSCHGLTGFNRDCWSKKLKKVIKGEKFKFCNHKFYFEPSKKDMNKSIFLNKELSRTVLRCSKCKWEIPYPLIK